LSVDADLPPHHHHGLIRHADIMPARPLFFATLLLLILSCLRRHADTCCVVAARCCRYAALVMPCYYAATFAYVCWQLWLYDAAAADMLCAIIAALIAAYAAAMPAFRH